MTQSGISQTTWPFDPLIILLFIQSISPILFGYDDQIWKNFVFNEPMPLKVQLSCRLMHS